MSYAFWADVIVALHFAYVCFVVLGEVAILAGWLFRWEWVRNPWLRLVHLLAIAVVAAEAILHLPCPVTVWEHNLRELAGQKASTETFVGRLVHFLMLDGDNPWPPWVYDALHIGFGVLVLATLFLVPPRWRDLRVVPRRRDAGGRVAAAS